MSGISAAVRSELAPTGKLRVGIDMSNFLLTRTLEANGVRGLTVAAKATAE